MEYNKVITLPLKTLAVAYGTLWAHFDKKLLNYMMNENYIVKLQLKPDGTLLRSEVGTPEDEFHIKDDGSLFLPINREA